MRELQLNPMLCLKRYRNVYIFTISENVVVVATFITMTVYINLNAQNTSYVRHNTTSKKINIISNRTMVVHGPFSLAVR